MKEVLERYFASWYHSPKVVAISGASYSSAFSRGDVKVACHICKTSPDTCDKVVLNCDTRGETVEVLDLESFLNSFNGLKALPSKRKCDLLLSNERKIVFCDMTCSQAKYIDSFLMSSTNVEKIGKRMTALCQLRESLTVLHNVPEVAAEIDSKEEKVVLFAFRSKSTSDMTELDQQVAKSMASFNNMSSVLSEDNFSFDVPFGFVYSEVMYPDSYVW